MARNADAPPRYMGLALGILCVAVVGSPPIAPWQDEGHVLVNRVAAEALPEEMPAFLRGAVDRLAYLGPEPDRWRRASEFTLKESQEPEGSPRPARRYSIIGTRRGWIAPADREHFSCLYL